MKYPDIPSLPLHTQVEDAIRQQIQQHLAVTDWCVRVLLQFWVSELEPEVVWGPDGDLLGLGFNGHVAVHARWIAHADLLMGRCAD